MLPSITKLLPITTTRLTKHMKPAIITLQLITTSWLTAMHCTHMITMSMLQRHTQRLILTIIQSILTITRTTVTNKAHWVNA
jgi:hypothetical protein